MGTSYRLTATITGTAIRAEMTDEYAGTTEVIFTEPRPATFADADVALAAYGLGRVRDWELGESGTVTAKVAHVDNRFNGTRAARLDQAIGTTHDELVTAHAEDAQNGDIITDFAQSALYVVAGCSTEGETVKIHMVGEGQTWDDRFTGQFLTYSVVKLARKR